MSQRRQVYQWFKRIAEHMPLGKWQAFGLAMFSLGVAWSEHSWLSKIAERLWMFGKADTVERRFQRWIDNPRIDIAACCRAWAKWVLSSLVDAEQIILLVDLTKLSDRLDVLMVGLAYRKRCIPLAWRCLPGNQPWPERQVPIIADLLAWIAAGIPEGYTPLVEADQGIGNSSALMRVVAQRGWHFMFRIKDTTTIQLPGGQVVAFSQLIAPGRRWSGSGILFPNSHPILAHVHLLWRSSMDVPWCLVTNAPHLPHHSYAQRVWQEQGFRDLKSAGWQWHRSQVCQLDHADRLLLVLTLAYAWVLSLGTQAIRAGKALRRQLLRGRHRRWSVFRIGLRYLYHLSRIRQPPSMALFFRPALS
jgi:hypothetical protein